MQLIWPSLDYLLGCEPTLKRCWSPELTAAPPLSAGLKHIDITTDAGNEI
jgi:hypothetical protein